MEPSCYPASSRDVSARSPIQDLATFFRTWLPSSRIRAANLCRAPVAQSVPQGEGVERGWAA